MSIIPSNIKLWIQEGPGCMLYFSYPGYGATAETKKQHDFWYEFALLFVKDGMWLWACDENDMQRIAKLYIENQRKDADYTKKLMSSWHKKVAAFYSFCRKIDKKVLTENRFANISDDKFISLLEEFTQLYIAEYAIPILIDATSFYCESEIQRLLKSELEKKQLAKEYNNYLTALTQPVHPSFINEENIELLSLAHNSVSGKDISKAVEKHARNWFWVHNNYARAIVLDKEYFFTRIKEHAKEGNKIKEKIDGLKAYYAGAAKQKQQVIENAELSEDLKLLINLSDKHVYWQDLRKKANLIADHYLEMFVSEISKRKNIAVEDLKTTSAYELIELMKSSKDSQHSGLISEEKFKERRKMCCMMFKPHNSVYFNHDETKIIDEEIRKRGSSTNVKDIFGTVANMGRATAVAKVISGPKDFDKLKQGEIIITSMTRPEFLPIMKRAAGIVTDEGGLTCHAAIVARELGIPCIIGTKIATRVIKDGDLVEVNANHGVVRKL